MAVQFRTLELRPAGPRRAKSNAPSLATAALGQVLLERGLITAEQLNAAIEQQRGSNRRLGQMLVDLGFATADAVLGALSVQLGVPATRLNGFTVSPAAVLRSGIPVARLDGRPATPLLWASLLAPRLAV